jgi:glycosyltransferase involved in cell wall biosynthesis
MSALPLTRKKVLFLITKSNWGGAQRYVFDLATGINQELFEPVVALGGTGELKTRLENAGIRVITIESLGRDISLRKEFDFAWELFAIVRKERPYIFHVNSSKAGGVGTLIGRICRVPKIIFTAHGWAFNEDRPHWQKLIIKTLHYITVLLSHRTIMVVGALLKQLPWPGMEKRSKIIYLGRSVGATFSTTEARDRLCELMKLDLVNREQEIWIGTIGELHPIKRQAVLIESMIPLLKERPNLRLFIIGDGELRDELRHRVTISGVRDQIILTGAINDAARFLKALDVFVLCSHSEAGGYVAHEAGLAEVATIVTNVGGLPEMIEHNVSGLIVPRNDAAALRAAIAELIDNPTKRQTFAATHYVRMRERSLEKMIAATETVYRL